MRRIGLVVVGALLTAAVSGCASTPAPVHRPPAPAAARATASPGPAASTLSPPAGAASAALKRTVGAPVSDVTFVSAAHGWASTSGGLYETGDGGAHWRHVRTPDPRVTHVRFVTGAVGYAWDAGGQLWLTSDDTATWRRAGLSQVDALEGDGAGVWALAGSLPGAHVLRSEVGSTRWRDLGLTPNRSGALLLQGGATYVLGEQGAGPIAPSYDVYLAGTRVGNHRLPCQRPQRYVPQSPMAAASDGTLFLVCDVAPFSAGAEQLAYTSRDRGTTWAVVPAPPVAVDGVAATPAIRWGWGRDLWAFRDGRWRLSLRGPGAPAGSDLVGFSVAGFEDAVHGIALTNAGQLYRTNDAGRTWSRVALPTQLPRDCSVDQLHLAGGRQGGGGAGVAHVDVQITNTGSASCALPSPTSLDVVDPSGKRLPLEVVALDRAAGASAVPLRPNGVATLALSWENWCGGRPPALTIRLAVAGGSLTGTFDGPPNFDFWPGCVTSGKRSILQVLAPYTVS